MTTDVGSRVATSIAAIMERAIPSRVDRSRGAIRRAVSEVLRAFPGEPADLWWRWILESAASLGLRGKAVDCDPQQMIQLAEDGARIVLQDPRKTGEWIAVVGIHRNKLVVADSEREEIRVRRSACQNWFSRSEQDTLRCVVLEEVRSNEPAVEEAKREPLERLRMLLRAERSDIGVVLVFAFVVGLLALATPIAVEALVNNVAFGRFMQPVVVLSLVLLTFLAFKAAMRGLQTYVVEIIQRRLFARVAADLSYRLPRSRVSSLDGRHAPELVNRFFDVVTVQKVSAQLLLDGVSLVLNVVIGMVVLAFYHPWLLGFDVVLLACIAFIIIALGRGAVNSAVTESKKKYKMAAWLQDVARCPTVFRHDGGSDLAMERADHLIHGYLSSRRAHFRILMRQILFALGLQAIASTVLLGLGGYLVISRQLTLGQLVAAELIVTVIVGAFAKLGKHLESFYDLLAAVDKLGQLFDLPVERTDGIILQSGRPVRLEMDGLGYAYEGRDRSLNAVTARLGRGESMAVMGGSGSGKSTLLDVIHGLRSPASGQVTLEGYEPQDLRPDTLRRSVALVRDTSNFDGSIAENIHLHRPEVTSQDVRDALDSIGLLDELLRFDDGFDTHLTSDGKPLSENQKRRLSIARAIAGNPGLIMIDGLLDALPDDELERALSFLLGDERPWTIVIATGREQIARRCEHIIRLSGPLAGRNRIQNMTTGD